MKIRGAVPWAVIAAMLAATGGGSATAGEFLLRDGDTVAFLGDSITAARGYTKIVEHYVLMRFPDRRIRFYNAGKGGDTAATSFDRLERDVFSRNATVMLVALGVNDIGWGARADDEHKQAYLDGVERLITTARDRGVRTILCSPAITAEPADKAEHGFLQRMADEGFERARSLGAGTIDVQRAMRDVQRRIEAHNAAEADTTKHVSLHAADGVHLNDLGQLAMAYAILKGLGAPAEVSSAAINGKSGEVTAARGCIIEDVNIDDGVVRFTRHDDGLPLTRGPLSSLDYRWIPLPQELGQYMLQLTSLESGRYDVVADDRLVQQVTAAQLAEGINISIMTPDAWTPGGPWNIQSDIVKELVDARDQLLFGRRLREVYPVADGQDAELNQHYGELDGQMTELMRATARPRPYQFEIKPASEP